TDAVARALATYRRHITTGVDAHGPAEEASRLLLRVMSRNERPRIEERSMLEEHVTPADDLLADDLAGYVRLKDLATLLDPRANLMSVEYWKSAPYFLTFTNGYRLRQRIRDRGTNPDPSLTSALTAARHLTRAQIERQEQVDLGNARLRRLSEEFLDTGAWRLLWMPPSRPYLAPAGVYAGLDTTSLTTRLAFTSWTATPASVASLLSYEVNRRMLASAADSAESARGRLLDYRTARTPGARPPSMSTLMLFWPMPGLAALADPRRFARAHASVTAAGLIADARPGI